jgi:iron complex transport system permease protein
MRSRAERPAPEAALASGARAVGTRLVSSAGSQAGRRLFWVIVALALPLAVVGSLSAGRYAIPFANVIGILLDRLVPLGISFPGTEVSVVELVRLPRILAALLAGAGLAIAGAALQGVFRNPLVGPQIIGVSSGAGFGGALAILLFGSAAATVGFAFVFGLGAIALVYLLSRIDSQAPILLLVLAGVVTSAFFTALISLVKYVADPDNKLPAIVYWLMGSLASIGWTDVLVLAVPAILGGLLIFGLRFRINVLSFGDEDAHALGVPVERTRWLVLVAVALISAAVVAVAGIVGWIGLVVPHFARGLVGPSHDALLPAAAALGALYLLLIDDVARTATAAEIPLGILTALIGAPVFAFLLRRMHLAGWRRD